MSPLMESPFSQHLLTNYVPTDLEVNQIKTHLTPHVSEASRLEALIKDLSAQRQKIVDYIAEHRALISLARRLPRDVVQEVFLACLPTTRNAVLSAKEAPLILARICSAWRTIALSTPSIWTSLHLPLEYVLDGTVCQEVAGWLERSGRCSISLSIVGAQSEIVTTWAQSPRQLELFQTGKVDRFFQVLAGSADRWQTLDLSLEMNEGLDRLVDVYPATLKAVKFNGSTYRTQLSAMKLLTTPSLREVTLHALQDFDVVIPQLPLCWDHLTHLTFEGAERFGNGLGLSPTVALHVLTRCPRLVSFKSDTIKEHITDLIASQPFTLPALRVLRLKGRPAVASESVDYLLHCLDMPQLRHLQLPHTTASRSTSSFLGSLVARSPLLEDLYMDLEGINHRSIVQNIGMFPALKRLSISDSRRQNGNDPNQDTNVEKLLESLTHDTNDSSFPMLAEMHIGNLQLSWRSTVLVDFARNLLDRGGNQLKCIEVECGFFMAPSIDPDILADFAARGLIIITSSCMFESTPEEKITPWSGLEDPSVGMCVLVSLSLWGSILINHQDDRELN